MHIEREDRTPPLARVKGVRIQQKLITVMMPEVAVHSLKLTNEQFTLPTVGHRNILHIVIRDFSNHSTSWGYNVTDDNGHAISH